LPINIASNINWTAMYWGLDTADKKLQVRFIEIASEADLVVYVSEKDSDDIEPLNPEQEERATDEFSSGGWPDRRRPLSSLTNLRSSTWH
jgi:hypothetical protein